MVVLSEGQPLKGCLTRRATVLITLEELAISSMWEMAALVEVLEKKGVLKKQDIFDAIWELRKKNPMARTPREFDKQPEPAFPEPYLLTETADAIITQILDLMNGQKLTAHQAKALLHRCLRVVDLGERLGKQTMH